ncbi:class I SAM-dependent methyltransferase [Oscillospiraceae bacterium MB08-C2-2]|nr:class I SAM-dependent methyltransferase [Oscillospiraceae bacterium MB08-C2-2]
MERNAAIIQEYFNDRAAGWDAHSPFNPQKMTTVLSLCDIHPGSEILDVGCGTGSLEPLLLEYHPKRILGVDFASNMISVARQKLSRPDVTFMCGDIFELKGYLFDQCFVMNTFPHILRPVEFIEHLASLLRPGGRLTISHSQGKKTMDATHADVKHLNLPLLPGQGLLNIMKAYFRMDILIDNNLFFVVSGTRL